MRACTYNIRHGRPPRRSRPDHPLLVDTVRSLDADVIGLQEVDRGTGRVNGLDQPAMIALATGIDTRFARAIDHDGGQYGVLLGVRGTIVGSSVIDLPGTGEPRVALLATVRPSRFPGGPEWAVACTHLTTLAHEVTAQLDRVLSELETLADGRPAVLLGDLNAGEDVIGPTVADRGWSAAPTGATHPSTTPQRRIDWVLVRGATVIGSVVPDVRASDHRPVVAVVDADPAGQDASVDERREAPYPA